MNYTNLMRYIQRPDIAFSREDANRYLPWVVAVMVCLSSLLMAAGISLHQASVRSGQLNLQSFQLYIPYDRASDALSRQLETAIAAHAMVRQVERIEADALEHLLMPWTSGAMELEQLPLPMVMEITLQPHAAREKIISEIKAIAQALEPGVDVESYQDWVDQMTQFTQMLRLGVFTLVGLLLAALMALVIVVVRTSLMLHFQAVRLLHHIGASDEYIVRQFVANSCLMVLKGSAMGMGLASMIAVAISYLSVQSASPLLPAVELSGLHVLILVLLPLLVVVLTALMVRMVILQMLEQMH